MQLSPSPITWTEVFRLLIAASIGLIPFLVTSYRNRKKTDLENKEIEARAELARVNARSTEFRDSIAAGEGVGKLLSALIEAGDTIHELQGKNFQLEQDKLGEDMMRLDLKKAIALLAFHSIPFHTAEHHDVKKMVEAYENLTKRQSKG
jgi:hypothetical protein